MKNLKKSLVILLTACVLLVSMLASVFAASDLDLSSEMIISVPQVTNDFEGEKVPSFSNTGGSETQFEYATQLSLQYYKNDGNANKYLSIKSKEEGGSVLTSNNQYLGFNFGTSLAECVTNQYGFIYNDYAVFDFEICADSYIDANGYFTNNEFDAYGNKNALSYPKNLQLSFYYRVGSSSGDCVIGGTPVLGVGVDPELGYYLNYNGGGVSKIPLSDKINEWTHVTMVYEIDNSIAYFTGENYTGEMTSGDYDSATVSAIIAGEHEEYKSFSCNLSKTKLHIYADGVYMGTDTTVINETADEGSFWSREDIIKAGGIEKAGLYQSRMYAKNSGLRFSYALDNFAYNLYRNGYDGDLARQIKTPKTPIYYCDDVVYSGNYDAPDGTAPKAIVYNDIEESASLNVLEVSSTYDVAIGALKNATSQQYVFLTHGIENFYPTTEFFVYVPEGETFTTAGDSGYIVSTEPTLAEIDGKTYEFYFVSETVTYQIVWYGDMALDNNTEVLQTSRYLLGSEIVYRGEEPASEIISNNKHRVFEGWKYVSNYDENGDPIWVDFDKTVVDESVIQTIETCFGEFAIAPSFVEKTAYYAITNVVGVIEGYAYDTADNLALDINAGKSIKLLSDIDELYAENIIQYNGKTYIAFGTDAKVVIDLNGHMFNLNSITYDYAFLLGKNASLTIKSSLPGGTVVANCGIARGNENGRSKLYLGTAGDVAGDNANLTVYAKSLFGTQGNNNNYAHTVAVYGVNYYGMSDGSVINQVGMMVNVEIYDSIFFLEKSGSALLRVNKNISDKAKGAINATVTNSTIVSTKEDGAPDVIVHELGNYTGDTAREPIVPVYQATFNNCMLYGTVIPTDNSSDKLTSENKGKVYFTGGTRIVTNENLDCDAVASGTAGNKIASVDSEADVTLYTPDGKVTKTLEFVYQEQLDIGYNITLSATNGIFFNVEIKKGYVNAVYTEMGGEALAGVDLGDKIRYTIPVPVASANEITIYLYRNNGDIAEISASLPQYFRSAFKRNNGNAEMQTLIVNAANYVNALYRFVNKGADYAEYKNFIETNKSMLITATDEAHELSVTDTSVISAVQLIVTEGNVPAFAFTKVSDGVVSIKYADNTVICAERTILGVTYYVAEGMAVSDMATTFEIYVGEDKIGEYNIQSYIKSTDNQIANALYGYAVAAENAEN